MTTAEVTRLTLGRGLRILAVELVQTTGEIETYDMSGAALTILSGPRNSSKTTTLKVIDYCLGGRGSVAEELGSAIDEKYLSLSTSVAIDGTRHTLTRELTQGRRGKILLDHDVLLTPTETSDWLMRALGWPRLSIPLGRVASTATQQTPLTFRSALRHIYRREDSWTEFAYKEQEYLRRAVVSLFLGFAPSRYENAEFELGQAQRRLAAAEAVSRDAVDSTESAVASIVRQLGLPPVVGSESLEGVHRQLTTALSQVRRERDALVSEVSRGAEQADAVGLDPELPDRLNNAAQLSAGAAEEAAALANLLEEHQRSQSFVLADIARLDRLSDAVGVFDSLPVRICPVCEQDVDVHRSHDTGTCYLCFQEVTEDVRSRRADRERRTLSNELDDLTEAVARVQQDLAMAQERQRTAADARSRLAKELQDARISQMAPFMARLEDLAGKAGRLEQQLAAIPAMEDILARRTKAANSVAAAQAEVERLQALAEADRQMGSDATIACAVFADRMNSFLQAFRTRGWVEGSVTISASDLTFYVGTRPWDDNLGAEARVIFFFAYCYALLSLDADLPLKSNPPGLLLLDNPYQQGLADAVVVEATDRIGAAAAELGVQVILTQARPAAGLTTPHAEIRMPREYAS